MYILSTKHFVHVLKLGLLDKHLTSIATTKGSKWSAKRFYDIFYPLWRLLRLFLLWELILEIKLKLSQSALSCKMKRQNDCLTERKLSLFLQQTQQTLVFVLFLAATTPDWLWTPTLTYPAWGNSCDSASVFLTIREWQVLDRVRGIVWVCLLMFP